MRMIDVFLFCKAKYWYSTDISKQILMIRKKIKGKGRNSGCILISHATSNFTFV